jgi:hypothetical protein
MPLHLGNLHSHGNHTIWLAKCSGGGFKVTPIRWACTTVFKQVRWRCLRVNVRPWGVERIKKITYWLVDSDKWEWEAWWTSWWNDHVTWNIVKGPNTPKQGCWNSWQILRGMGTFYIMCAILFWDFLGRRKIYIIGAGKFSDFLSSPQQKYNSSWCYVRQKPILKLCIW